MKIKCNRAKFSEAFQTVASVAPSRSPKTILQNVKLDVHGGEGVLSATDLEVGIRCTVPEVEVQVEGSAVLPVTRFGAILREAPDEQLELEADPQGTRVLGQRSEFKLPSQDPAEFPDVATFDSDKFHEVPARFLREVIRRTIFATDTDSSRYALGGVLFELTEDHLTAVGTDGRRLAKMEGPALAVNGHHTTDQMTIVPTRALQLMERALSDGDAEIQLTVRSNDLLVRSPWVTISTRLVEGRYPKWRDVFPASKDGVAIELPVGPFYSAVRQAAIVTSEESRGIDFKFGKGNVTLAAQTADTGQSRIELPIGYQGDEITIMLDPKYINDFLKVVDVDKTFTLEIRDAKSAAVCKTDDGYGYVIMPMAREK
ncbi:MAG: DNA polymerase III subunit beta [Planctomycetales bacterium]|nr:DNA polymerase III subunit beta [Planctomycetales bacterium]NIM07887.1 DNA polymerase III subunit beta [Planctomycetales bacterium]NIN09027.1 DNA polymerase III subunit beta [Planctomycetales bacterium]NIN78140.1 DNA polymerase III subunit beta [Planctomycetales bacterium]NIO33668.1 DNA polymerase III subunit beta [Planctomycetales bacterium]